MAFIKRKVNELMTNSYIKFVNTVLVSKVLKLLMNIQGGKLMRNIVTKLQVLKVWKAFFLCFFAKFQVSCISLSIHVEKVI